MRLDALINETAEPDWDCERGHAIPREQWELARRFAEAMGPPSEAMGLVSDPFFSPCGDGTIHVEWTVRGGDRFVVEVGNVALGHPPYALHTVKARRRAEVTKEPQ